MSCCSCVRLNSSSNTTMLTEEKSQDDMAMRHHAIDVTGLAETKKGWGRRLLFIETCSLATSTNFSSRYRVFIRYCVFSEFLKIFRTLFSLGVSVCTNTRQVEIQRCSRTGRVQKNQTKIKEKTQYLINTLYNIYRSLFWYMISQVCDDKSATYIYYTGCFN